MDNPMINIGGWCACAGFLLCFKSQLWRSSLDISWGSVRSDVCGLLVTRPGVQTVSIYAVSLYTPHWHSPLWRHTTFRHTASSAALAPAAGSPEHSVLALLHINITTSPSPMATTIYSTVSQVSPVSTQIQTGGSSVTQQHPHTTKT